MGSHIAFAGNEEFVPEKRLKGIEIKVGPLEETDLAIGSTHILLVHTVDDEHILRGEFHASHFHAEERERKLHHIIALHAQLTIDADALPHAFEVNFDLGREARRCQGLGCDFLHEGRGRCVGIGMGCGGRAGNGGSRNMAFRTVQSFCGTTS